MDVAKITTVLRINPSRAWQAGEPSSTPSGRLLKGNRRQSYWVARISEGKYTDTQLCAAISEVLDQLMPHRAFFHQISSEGGRTEFFIGWFFEGQSGDTFDCDLLSRLGDMKIDLALDIYPS